MGKETENWLTGLQESRASFQEKEAEAKRQADAEIAERRRAEAERAGARLREALIWVGVLDEDSAPITTDRVVLDDIVFLLSSSGKSLFENHVDPRTPAARWVNAVMIVERLHPNAWNDPGLCRDIDDTLGTRPPRLFTEVVCTGPDTPSHVESVRAKLADAVDTARALYDEFDRMYQRYLETYAQKAADAKPVPADSESEEALEFPMLVALNTYPDTKRLVEKIRELNGLGYVIQHIFYDSERNPWAIIG